MYYFRYIYHIFYLSFSVQSNSQFRNSTALCQDAAANAALIKRTVSEQLRGAMQRNKISQSELARRMRTSRALIHRLLDEQDLSVTLATISKAAVALDQIFRVDASPKSAPSTEFRENK